MALALPDTAQDSDFVEEVLSVAAGDAPPQGHELCGSCQKSWPASLGAPVRTRISKGGAESTQWRCYRCGALRSRQQRVAGKLSDEVAEAWAEMSAEKRASWMAKNHESFGDQLVASMEKEVEEEVTVIQHRKLVLKGKFFVRSHFENKYKDDPETLERVLQNAPQMTHPDSKLKVWADRDLEVDDTAEEVRYRAERKRMFQETKLKAVKGSAKKKPKRKKAADPVQDEGLKPIAPSKLKQVTNAVTKLDGVVKEMQTLLVEAAKPANVDYIQPKLLKKTEPCVANAIACIAKLNVLKEAGRGDPKEDLEEFKKYNGQLVEHKKALEGQLADAADSQEEEEEEEAEEEDENEE